MTYHDGRLLVALAGLFTAVSQTASAEEGRGAVGSMSPVIRERVAAVERLVESRSDESLTPFLEKQLSPTALDSRGRPRWIDDLKAIRKQCAGFGTIKVERPAEWSIVVRFGGTRHGDMGVQVDLEAAEPHLIQAMSLQQPGASAKAAADAGPPMPPLTWENLRERLKDEEQDGFSGSVLVIRKGEVILNEGYGFADREKKIPNRPDTIFAIGSTPIDFTKASILKLQDMGKLKGDDPITKFLPNVPPDKKDITVDQLMTGRSGLRNFHGRQADADQDNDWIDRDTAVKRILEDELLFAPGTDRAHSHSAFGLLAAIVEIVSGDPISTFYRKHLFDPAGMTRTSLYEDIHAPQEQIAIGYGGSEYSTVNSPNHWGKTSWLVIGSGGMASTTGDLHRFNQALRSGKILSPAAAGKYWSPGGGLGVGASQNGFFTALTEGPTTMFFLCSNVIGRQRTDRLIRDLAKLR